MKPISKMVKGAVKSAAVAALLAWERAESGVSYDPTSPKVRAYPYDVYEKIRRKDPVHRLRMVNGWILTEYADVDRVLRDHKRFSNESADSVVDYKSFLGMDPPDHTRLRGLVSRAFTPRSVSALAPRIERVVGELLDALEGRDKFDLIESFAYPLPITVIAEMMGVPPEDMGLFERWSNDISLVIEPTVTDEQRARIRDSSQSLFDYFEGIMERRRREPKDDIISALMAVEDAGDRLTHDELLATLLLLLVAGNETTRNLIGNGTLALIKHPDQMARLRDDPDLMESAIHEMLRYDSPVQLDGRDAAEDVEIGGKRIRAGQRVISSLGAANRDPSAFSNPNALDISRAEKSHISFGRGIHHCLGAPLAVLEGRIAFAGLLERFSSFTLLAEPRYRDQVVLRGVRELWVEVERDRA